MQISELNRYYWNKPVMNKVKDYYQKRGVPYHNKGDADFQLDQNLAKLGWYKIGGNAGEGSYSKVFTNDKKHYVMKVNHRPDPAFSDFAALVKSHPNPHFPKIGKMQTFEVYDDTYYVYLIEKLEKIEIGEAIELSSVYESIVRAARMGNDSAIKNHVAKFKKFGNKAKKYKLDDSLIDALILIGKMSGDHVLDLHEENIMMRKDGTIVITDPLS